MVFLIGNRLIMVDLGLSLNVLSYLPAQRPVQPLHLLRSTFLHSLRLSLHQVLQLQPCNTLNLLSFSSFFVVRLTLNHHYTEPRRYQHFFNPLHFTTNDFLYLLVITSYIFLFYLSWIIFELIFLLFDLYLVFFNLFMIFFLVNYFLSYKNIGLHY